jgi:hypothetical protein
MTDSTPPSPLLQVASPITALASATDCGQPAPKIADLLSLPNGEDIDLEIPERCDLARPPINL